MSNFATGEIAALTASALDRIDARASLAAWNKAVLFFRMCLRIDDAGSLYWTESSINADREWIALSGGLDTPFAVALPGGVG